ncbi:hypothetical protein BS78_04G125800 [Paspalum vaginatum]|nr:hypothetical protein BS78_04G125800 [Paspalum vaginatum]
MCSYLLDGDVEENMDPYDDSDWLHRNETYQANDTITTRGLPTAGPNNAISPAGNSIERKRQRDRERHAKMSAEQRDEINKRRREASTNSRQQNKGQNMTPNVSGDGDEENMDPDDDIDSLHRNETYQANDTLL